MLLAILSCCTAEELEESSSDDEKPMDNSAEAEAAAAARRAAIKQKIMAVGKMRRVFQLLRYVYLLSRDGMHNEPMILLERKRKLPQN